MKKITLLLAFIFTFAIAKGQVKVWNDGQVSLGTLSNSRDVGMQVYSSGSVYFNTNNTDMWHWVTLATPGTVTGKCWIVTYPGNKNDHRFYVTGNGNVFSWERFQVSDESFQSNPEPIRNAGSILNQIAGIWYTPSEERNDKSGRNDIRHAGVSAQQLAKILPEAVMSDENGMLYVNYEVLTVFLIETVKGQQKEIELLRKVLENNGLIKEH